MEGPWLDPSSSFFFFFNYLFIYLFNLFMAVLGLRFCARAFSGCGERGPLFIAVHGPLTIAASLVAEHRLQTRRLSSCGSRAQPLRGTWDLPRPGHEPVSPALAGRFSTTAPPGKAPSSSYKENEPPWRQISGSMLCGGSRAERVNRADATKAPVPGAPGGERKAVDEQPGGGMLSPRESGARTQGG